MRGEGIISNVLIHIRQRPYERLVMLDEKLLTVRFDLIYYSARARSPELMINYCLLHDEGVESSLQDDNLPRYKYEVIHVRRRFAQEGHKLVDL